MTEAVNAQQNVAAADPIAPSGPTEPAVQRILAASAGLGQLSQRPLAEVAEQLDALHSELQAALVDVDNSAKN